MIPPCYYHGLLIPFSEMRPSPLATRPGEEARTAQRPWRPEIWRLGYGCFEAKALQSLRI